MNLSRTLTRSFGLLLAVLLFLVGFSIYNFRRLAQADDWKVHTYQVLLENHRLSESLSALDSAVRGFVVTNRPEPLFDYQNQTRGFTRHYRVLQDLTRDRSAHQALLQRIEAERLLMKREFYEPTIAMRRVTPDDTQALLKFGKTSRARRVALARITAIIDEIETVENALLEQRTREQHRWQNLAQFTLFVGGIFSILLTTALISLAANASRKLAASNANLLSANSELETAQTTLQRANQQLLDSKQALELEVRQRRAAEERLRRSVADLQRSNAELEQFAYVASHDLQEPLRAVAGCVQVLQKRYAGQLDARADQFIGHAVDGAQRMQNLIQDLLAYSRVGTRSKKFENVEVEAVFARVLLNVSVAIDETGALVTHDALPTVCGDGGQLEQLLQNLLSNALKFRGAEATRVHVGYKREGEHHEFRVSDNGPGIEPQYFERIFVMFQRLHSRTEYSGTGIGLAICKKIAERHGGKIWVESEVGRGSTFGFSLALNPETDEELASSTKEDSASNEREEVSSSVV